MNELDIRNFWIGLFEKGALEKCVICSDSYSRMVYVSDCFLTEDKNLVFVCSDDKKIKTESILLNEVKYTSEINAIKTTKTVKTIFIVFVFVQKI